MKLSTTLIQNQLTQFIYENPSLVNDFIFYLFIFLVVLVIIVCVYAIFIEVVKFRDLTHNKDD